MNLKIRTFSMALAAMSATSYMYALPSNNIEEKSSTKEKKMQTPTQLTEMDTPAYRMQHRMQDVMNL